MTNVIHDRFNDNQLLQSTTLRGPYVVRFEDGRVLRYDRELLARMARGMRGHGQVWKVQGDGKIRRLA